MANYNFQQIIDDISYSQQAFPAVASFRLAKDSKIILNTNDETDENILKHINGKEDFNQDRGIIASISIPLNSADAEFGRIVEQFRVVSRAPFSFLYDVVNNRNSRVGFVEEVRIEDSFVDIISFTITKDVKLLEYGLGKNLSWAKIQFTLETEIGTTLKEGFCLIKDLTKLENVDKNVINYGPMVKLQGSNPKLFLQNIVYKPIYSPEVISRIVYNQDISSYTVLTEVDINNFIGLTEEMVRTKFAESFSKSIKDILKFANKKSDKNYEQDFFCFGKIQNYYISTRNGEKPTIFVSVPWRNIEAVAEVDNALLDGARLLLRSPEIINNIRREIDKTVIFDIDSVAPNLLSVLPTSQNTGLRFDYASEINTAINGDSKLKPYVSPKEIPAIQERIVLIPFEDIPQVEQYLNKSSEVIKEYNKKLSAELEQNEESEAYIDLALYVYAFNQFISKLKDILVSNAEVFINETTADNTYSLQFLFNGPNLLDLSLLSDTGSIIKLEGVSNLITSSPVNDVTFSFFLCNINSLNNVDTNAKVVTDFMAEYVFPDTLSKIKYSQNSFNNFKQKELDCLKNYETATKDRLAASTNEFLNNIISKESIKNLEDSFSQKEWEIVFNELKRITDVKLDSAIDLSTINWHLIIDELTKCITNVELKDLVIIMLGILKNWQINEIPLSCQIPPAPIPRFPRINLPKIPNLPSIVTSYYDNFTNIIVNSRTDLIQTIIRGILDLAGLCRENIDPENIGKTKPEDLLNDFVESQQGLESAGLIQSNSATKQQEANEIKLILDATSKVLTKNEFLTLLLGTSSQNTLKLAKNQITELEKNSLIVIIPNTLCKKAAEAEYTDLSDNKVITFFAKFKNSIKTDELINFSEQRLSADADLLCLNEDIITSNIVKSLSKKGLSEQQIQEELEKKRKETETTIKNFASSLTALNKELIATEEVNCIVRQDNTLTPGLNDKLGVPEAFKISKESVLTALYDGFDKSYNGDFKNWFINATQKSPSGSNIKSLFLKDYEIASNTNLIRKKYQANEQLRSISSLEIPSVTYGKATNNLIADFFNKSNDVISSVTATPTFKTRFEVDSYQINAFFSSKKPRSDLGIGAQEVAKLSTFSSVKDLLMEETVQNISLQLAGQGFNLTDQLPNINNFDKYHKEFVEKHLETRFIKSRVFELASSAEPKIKETLDSNPTSKILERNLNPILSKNDKKCKKPDQRLINLDEIKNKALKNSNSCLPPKLSADGKQKEPTKTDLQNIDAAIDLLIRLYSIDFNLKLIAVLPYAYLTNSNRFAEICYALFKADLAAMFGETFAKRIADSLSARDANVSDTKTFITVFMKNFKEVNEKIYAFYDIGLKNEESELIYSEKPQSYRDFLFRNMSIQQQPVDLEYSMNNSFGLLEKRLGSSTNIELRFFDGSRTGSIDDSNSLLLYATTKVPGYDFRQDRNLKAAFDAFFTIFCNVDEILAIYMGSMLASLTSISKINSSFNNSKQELKNIIDIIDAAGDYTKKLEDNGFTALFSKLKVLADVPEFFITSLAETTDPNVAIASPISKAYEVGVILAELAGVKVPVKKLPLILTSPFISAAGITPLTPQGFISIALSAKDLAIESGDSVTNDDQEIC